MAWGRRTLKPLSYSRWINTFDAFDDSVRRQISTEVEQLPSRPLISLLMPVCDDRDALQATLASLRAQLYPHWQIILVNFNSAAESPRTKQSKAPLLDGRVCFASVDPAETWAAKANCALAAARGAFVALITAGDLLPAHALYWVAREAVVHPDAPLIFSDEDTFRGNGTRRDPWFKSDWNPSLMLSHNAVGRVAAFSRTLLKRLGGFREGYEGAEEYELALRCARAIDTGGIRHVPRVLYHRRAKASRRNDVSQTDSGEAERRVANEHLAAQGITATVGVADGVNQVSYATPNPPPRVSIIIATTARREVAERCFISLAERTNYSDLEVVVLVHESDFARPERAVFLNTFADRKIFRIIQYSNRPFNYSWVNNLGVRESTGEILCFLNDDTEVISADWLQQLVARVTLPGVAAVGPMLYYPDETIQHAGVILGLGGVAGHACCHEPRGTFGYFGRACLEQDVSCVTAACMAIRADVFRKVGGFDETLPLAYNDVDLCLRVRAFNWRIIWTPAVELLHHESASLGRHDSPQHAIRYKQDVATMRERWHTILQADPFYSLNLSLDRPFRLAFPPRIAPSEPLFPQ